MSADTPRGVRPYGRSGAATVAALSVLATGVVVVKTPAMAAASSSAGTASLTHLAEARTAMPGPRYAASTRFVRSTHSYLTADQAVVQEGQAVVLTGKLTVGARELPMASHPVRLEEGSGSDWKTIANDLVHPDGSVTFTVRPARSTRYRLSYAGVTSLGASVSAEQAVTVKLPPPAPVRASSSGTTRSSSSAGSAGTGSAGMGSAGIGSAGVAASATGAAVVAAAAAQTGKPYVFAAAGPDAFDCSGLTMFVFAQFGVYLPHNADAQKKYGVPVSAANAAPGDLVVFLDGGYGYHVGIYAGGGKMYDAPTPGQTVGLHQIWSTNVIFRRLV